jgi:hypothetical protein
MAKEKKPDGLLLPTKCKGFCHWEAVCINEHKNLWRYTCKKCKTTKIEECGG